MSQDVAAIEHQLARYFSHVGADVELAAELYTEDAVLEFPQTGERFEGRESFTQWRAQAVIAAGDDVRFRLTRTTVRPDSRSRSCPAAMTGAPPGSSGCSWRTGRVTG